MHIYKTQNKINNKLYIGQCSKPVNESKNYYGSGTILKRAINKYGVDNFEKTILEFCPTQEILNTSEIYWIDKLNSMAPIGYNLTLGGGGVSGYKLTPKQLIAHNNALRKLWKQKEYRDNVLTSRKEFWSDENHRIERSIKVSGENNPMYGHNHTSETKLKISQKNTGNSWSDEQKHNFSKNNSGENNSFYGKHHTTETKNKLSQMAKKKYENKDERKKISDSLIEYFKTHDGPNKGKTFSDQTIENMSISMKKQWKDEAFRKKYSESRKGRKWMNKDGVKKLIKREEIDCYLNQSWNFGMGEY